MTWPWRTTQKYGFNDMGVPGEVPSNELDSKHSARDIAPMHRTCFFRVQVGLCTVDLLYIIVNECEAGGPLSCITHLNIFVCNTGV